MWSSFIVGVLVGAVSLSLIYLAVAFITAPDVDADRADD
jgi:hypothetical protein